jgi:hypothetical protein
LGRWQGRESKVNIDVKFEDVVRCDLPLARYSIAQKVHCTSELFSMLTAHVPTAFGMISSNVLAILRYRRHGWSTQAYYAQSHGDNTPQSPAGPPHHSPPLIRASRITEYAICQKVLRVVRTSNTLDGGYISYSRHHNPADNENESGALCLRCGEHHTLIHLAYM